MCVYVCGCLCVFVCMCVCVSMYVCVYVCMYVGMDGCILYCSSRKGLNISVGDQMPVGARFPAFFVVTVET